MAIVNELGVRQVQWLINQSSAVMALQEVVRCRFGEPDFDGSRLKLVKYIDDAGCPDDASTGTVTKCQMLKVIMAMARDLAAECEEALNE